MCPINDGIEDIEHSLLLRNLFKEHRRNLFACVNNTLEANGYSEFRDSCSFFYMEAKFAVGSKQINLEFNSEVYC